MKMTIMDLLQQSDTVAVFDVDGVLCPYENTDDPFDHEELDAIRHYENSRPIRMMQEWITEYKTPETLFVSTCCGSKEEYEEKYNFILRHYPGIPGEHIFGVLHKEEKLECLQFIQDKFCPNIPQRCIVMIEDTVETLNWIKKNSGFTTAHISSFMV